MGHLHHSADTDASHGTPQLDGKKMPHPARTADPGSLGRRTLRSFNDLKDNSAGFRPPFAQRPSLEHLIDFARKRVSGFFIEKTEEGIGLFPYCIGPAIALENARLVARRGRSWQNEEVSHFVQPFTEIESRNRCEHLELLPLIGTFFSSGQEIPDGVLNKCGLHPLMEVGENGEKTDICCPAILQGGRSIILLYPAPLPAIHTPEGGYAVAPSLDAAEEFITGIGVQYRGVGGEYFYHLAKGEDLHPGDVILTGEGLPRIPEGSFHAHREVYAGKSGIYLDVRHEYYGTSPTGGTSAEAASRDIERDALLWRHGAEMGGIVVDSISLLRADQLKTAAPELPDLGCDELRVSLRVLFEDTHRLDVLIHPEVRKLKNSDDSGEPCMHKPVEAYKVFIERKGRPYSDSLREDDLLDRARRIGKNMRVCLNLGFSLKNGQVSGGNLGVRGHLFDSENFFPMTNRFQIYPLFSAWISDLFGTAYSAGLSRRAFYAHPSFEAFLSELFGDEHGHPLAVSIKEDNARRTSSEGIDAVALRLSMGWVSYQMEREKICFDLNSLIKIHATCESLQELMEVDGHDFLLGNPTLFDLVDGYVRAALLGHSLLFGGGRIVFFSDVPLCEEAPVLVGTS